jgi:hypothetical protein
MEVGKKVAASGGLEVSVHEQYRAVPPGVHNRNRGTT